ncbi:NAD(P)H-binding protein [Lacticaseibacillus porcinae]|uniref:NmrA family NAD(P)-binding protein n=1 Tax=Lacticaseibacillus porcinae TaxID=1123687 RepID=UPI000F7BA8B8|nr:NAD(P)H-binding protein [Lacticaseibacillus porcinae]
MKITLVGSVGNINRFVIPRLVQAGHQVTVITSNAERTAQIQALGATPAVGNMANQAFLTQTFAGADVVYLMISGTDPDLFGSAKRLGDIFAGAVKAAKVPQVVNLSSIGAQDPDSGTLYAYHFIEDALSTLEADVAFVRPVGFYNNLFANLATLHQNHTLYANIPAAITRKMVAPSDIADVVYDVITNCPAGKTIRYVVSDTFTGTDMIDAFSQALGFDVHFVEISDAQYAENLRHAGIPESIVKPFVASTQHQRHPELMYADLANQPVINGHVKLADFATSFAQAFNAGDQAPKAHTVANK